MCTKYRIQIEFVGVRVPWHGLLLCIYIIIYKQLVFFLFTIDFNVVFTAHCRNVVQCIARAFFTPTATQFYAD